MSVDVETFTTQGLNFVKLRGSLMSGMSLSAAEARIRSILENGAKKLVLDITELTYADSSGLGVLVLLFGTAQKLHCEMRIAGANEKMLALLHVTRLDSILSLDATVEDSLKALLGQTAAKQTMGG